MGLTPGATLVEQILLI